MAHILKIIGVIVGIIGIGMMGSTMYLSADGKFDFSLTSGKQPTQSDLDARTPVMVMGGIVGLTGGVMIALGKWF